MSERNTAAPDRTENEMFFSDRDREENLRRVEEMEAGRRRREEAMRLRALKRQKQRREQMIAWAIVIGAAVVILAVVIAVICAIVGAVRKSSAKKLAAAKEAAAAAERTAIAEFAASDKYYYLPDGSVKPADLDTDALISFITARASDASLTTAVVGDMINLPDFLYASGDTAAYGAFRDRLADTPITAKGYVFSQLDDIKCAATDGYLYDSNTSFITAVCRVCVLEGSDAYLDTADLVSVSAKDISDTITLREKLDAAVAYLFDGRSAEGGLKYDTESGIARIYTTANTGTKDANPSTRGAYLRNGNIDLSANITFNRAMRALADLYALTGNDAEAATYDAYADKNAAAVTDMLWSEADGRFIGWIDANGIKYDPGDTAANMEAVIYGVATDSESASIRDWLDGRRLIDGDALTGDAIRGSYGIPAAYTGELTENMRFGDADIPAATLYHAALDLLCRGDASEGIGTLRSAFAVDGFASLPATPDDGLLVGVLLDRYMTKNAGGAWVILPNRADISLIMSAEEDTANTKKSKKKDETPVFTPSFGIKGLPVGSASVGVLAGTNACCLVSDHMTNERIRLAGFTPDGHYNVSVISLTDGAEEETTEPVELTATLGGVLTIEQQFGGMRALKITPCEPQDKAS